ncbi:MAG: hypothetical protein CL521_03550 [Actinobacteria bacterium]|nr:hypothetical protein [Actinomycetota bacterium]
MGALFIVCVFTFVIHMTEALAYCMRLAGVRVKQIAIAMAFVTSTLLISRLSNMIQAPFLGAMVDGAILEGGGVALAQLETQFRMVILAAFFGALMGAFLTPSVVVLFQKAIQRFQVTGSVPRLVLEALRPSVFIRILGTFRFPRFSSLRHLSFVGIPRQFLIINILVTSVYVIGVLCSLLAGAYLPELRATAIQLSGIVNGIATVLFTIFVDPSGARITDQALNGQRPVADVRSVVFGLQMGKLLGILVFAQLLLGPFSRYIMWVTEWVAGMTILP